MALQYVFFHSHFARANSEGYLLHSGTGGCKARKIPWTAILKNRNAYIPSKYLPDDFQLKECSKQGKEGLLLLLQHWHLRYKKYGAEEMFQFSHVPGPPGKGPQEADYDMGMELGFGTMFMEEEAARSDEEEEAPPMVLGKRQRKKDTAAQSDSETSSDEDPRKVQSRESDDEDAQDEARVSGYLSQIPEEDEEQELPFSKGKGKRKTLPPDDDSDDPMQGTPRHPPSHCAQHLGSRSGFRGTQVLSDSSSDDEPLQRQHSGRSSRFCAL